MSSKKHILGSCVRNLIALGSCLFGAFCSPSVEPSIPIEPTMVSTLQQALNFQDDLIVSLKNTLINQYAALNQDATQGTTRVIAQTFPSSLFDANLHPLDLVLIIQMQGANMNIPADPSSDAYGKLTDIRSAGLYEFAVVDAIDRNTPGPNQLTIHLHQGLKNNYFKNGHTQLVRVPIYKNIEIPATTSVTALPWDGNIGGIVVFIADKVSVNGGVIDLDGKGFRGGTLIKTASPDFSKNYDTYYSNDLTTGGEKGEGIFGSQTDYATMGGGSVGRGAAINGGGGGNSAHAGGGGGGNGGDLSKWTGHGVMDIGSPMPSPSLQKAWRLDPAFISTGSFATSSGGGRGGYTLSENFMSLDPTVHGPAVSVAAGCTWGTGCRLERGGRGGSPVPTDPYTRLFLGGAGGAGESQDKADANGDGGRGGNGGGLLLILAHQVSGRNLMGDILVNGDVGKDAEPPHQAGGGGGGGAGGTILIKANLMKTLTPLAQGGNGGNHLTITTMGLRNVANGTGGGGGGGIIMFPRAPLPVTTSGGINGVTNAIVMTPFNHNGATQGNIGTTLSILFPNEELQLAAKLKSLNEEIPGGTATFQVTVNNPNPSLFNVGELMTSLTPNYGPVTWACKPSNFSRCAQSSGTNHLSNLPIYVGPKDQISLDVTIPIPTNSACGDLNFTVALQNEAGPGRTVSVPTSIHAPVSLDITVDKDALQGLSEATYQFDVGNTYTGCQAQTNLRLQITLPSNSHLQNVSGDSWDCQSDNHAVICTQKEGTQAVSPVLVTILPPSGTDVSEMKAELFLPDSDQPAAQKTLLTPIVSPTLGAPSGGGFSCGFTTANTPSKIPTSLPFLLIGFVLLIVRRYRPKSQ